MAPFSRGPALIPVCNLAAPAAANHNLFVLCNIGMKLPDSRAGACDTNNGPEKKKKIYCNDAALLSLCVYIDNGADWRLLEDLYTDAQNHLIGEHHHWT